MEADFFYTTFGGITFQPVTFSAILSLMLSLVLLVCSALISASELAFFSFSPQIISELEESEKPSDQSIYRLLQSSQRLLATILIGNNFVNVAVILLLTHFTSSVLNFDSAPLIGFVFQTIIITTLLLLFGEIMPKIYASQYAKRTAVLTAPFIIVLDKIFKPIINLMVASTLFVNNKFGNQGRSGISMDELSQALELTTNEDEDTEILEGIIKFGNIEVKGVMTSRVDMVDIDIKSNYKQVLDIIIESGYSRIPVYAISRDNIKGILYIKDLLPHLDKPASFRWQTLVRPAYYVPETKKIDDLLNEFQENKIHMALVVDEYGGTSGLISLEDILEEIVGDISDEYDVEEKMFEKIDNHTFVFEAKILLNDFFKIAEIEEDHFVKVTDEVETLAGLILEIKGEMPSKNERIDYGQYVFEILAVDNRRIKKVKLYIK